MKPVERPLDDLLAHASWVRGLAGALVRDAASADDLAQDVWLAALRRGPSDGRPARPWLAGVARNLMRARARAAARRERHEKSAAPAASAPSPAQLAEQLETHRVLAALVAELPEPQRTVVLLRYFNGLSSPEIEKALGVPAGTVRRRLKDALDRLRERLDARHRGDRRAWALALAPLAGADGLPVAPGGPAVGGGIVGGMTAMTVAQKTSIAVALLIAVAAGLLWRGGDGGSATGASRPPREETADAAETPRGAPAVALRRRAEETVSASSDRSKTDRPAAAAAASTSGLRVTVRRDDGAAAAGARVLVVSADRVVADARTDSTGVAEVAACDGAVAVVASLPGLPPVEARVPAKRREVELTLASAQSHVAGVVHVDGAAPTGRFELRLQLESSWAGPDVVPVAAWTALRDAGVEPQIESCACDAAGRFRFDGLRAGVSVVLQPPRGFRLAEGRGDASGAGLSTPVPADDVFVDLVRLPRITGRVVDESGPASGAKVVLRLRTREGSVNLFDESSATADSDGRFELLLPTGELSALNVTASRTDGADAVLREVPDAPRRDVDLGDLLLAKSVVIPLLVVDEAGTPVVGAVARIDQDEPVASGPTDASGRTSLRAAAERVDVIVGALGFGATRVAAVGASDVPHRVVLQTAATIEISATTQAGAAVADAMLLLTLDAADGGEGDLGSDDVFVAAGASPNRVTIGDETYHARLLRLAADGPTILTGLRPGVRFRLRLLDALGASLADEVVRLEPRERRRIALTVAKPRWDLAVSVVGDDGRALAAADVRATSPAAQPEVAGLARYGMMVAGARSDAAGHATLGGLLGEEIDLLAWAPDRVPVRIRVKRATDAAVTVALARGRTVEIEVQDAAGDPVADAEIHAAPRDEDRDAPWAPIGIEDVVWRGVHVTAGTYRVSGLPAAEIVLVVRRGATERRLTHDAREPRARIRL